MSPGGPEEEFSSLLGPRKRLDVARPGIEGSVGALDSRGQAHKGAWGMSWRQEALKGVEDCEKPGEVVKRALIPGYPNWRTLNP